MIDHDYHSAQSGDRVELEETRLERDLRVVLGFDIVIDTRFLGKIATKM